MNKPVYLGLSVQEIYEICYDYVKPKYREKAKLCYVDKGSFVVYIKQKAFMQILQKILKQDLILQVMNQKDLDKKIKKIIGLMKDEFGGKVMRQFAALKSKTCSYLIDKRLKKVSHKTKT